MLTKYIFGTSFLVQYLQMRNESPEVLEYTDRVFSGIRYFHDMCRGYSWKKPYLDLERDVLRTAMNYRQASNQ